MRLAEVVDALAADLSALGSLGDDATADAARRLAAAMHAPITARLFDVLGQVAAELGATLPDRHVEVRLVGGDVQLSVGPAQQGPLTEEEAAGDDAGARITLRLPAQLKARVEEASMREGLSVNSYIVRALNQQVRAGTSPRIGRRLSGYGRA